MNYYFFSLIGLLTGYLVTTRTISECINKEQIIKGVIIIPLITLIISNNDYVRIIMLYIINHLIMSIIVIRRKHEHP